MALAIRTDTVAEYKPMVDELVYIADTSAVHGYLNVVTRKRATKASAMEVNVSNAKQTCFVREAGLQLSNVSY